MTEIDWDALEKEMYEINEKKKAWDKAWNRCYEIWGICSKNEISFWKWHTNKYPKKISPVPNKSGASQ